MGSYERAFVEYVGPVPFNISFPVQRFQQDCRDMDV